MWFLLSLELGKQQKHVEWVAVEVGEQGLGPHDLQIPSRPLIPKFLSL